MTRARNMSSRLVRCSFWAALETTWGRTFRKKSECAHKSPASENRVILLIVLPKAFISSPPAASKYLAKEASYSSVPRNNKKGHGVPCPPSQYVLLGPN